MPGIYGNSYRSDHSAGTNWQLPERNCIKAISIAGSAHTEWIRTTPLDDLFRSMA
jgi:hypothetical protein